MNEQNYYRTIRKKGRRLKKSKPNWRLVGVILIVSALLLFFTIVAVISDQYLSKRDQFTVEFGTPVQDCEFDYRNSDLNFVVKLCIPMFYKISDDVNINKLGTYLIFYDSRLPFMPDHLHMVEVKDTTPPELTLTPMEDTVFQDINDFVDPGYTAFDLCDGCVEVKTERFQSSPCWYTIRYTATDKSGNTAEQHRKINVVRGQVALTFDDGPSLNITPQILDVLAQNNVHATFFILGYGYDKEQLVLREFAEGHTIGYHGKSHQYKDIYTSLDALMKNFTSLEEDVINLTGYSSKLVRFPGGSSNTVSINYCEGIMSAAVTEVATAGYTYFDWNVDSGDAGRADTADEVYQNVISGIRAGHFNVVLMHDSASKQHTLDALQHIIDYCLENDYELVALDSHSPQITHKIAN